MDGFHFTDLQNHNHICLRCGAVEPFEASGLTAALLDSMSDFQKRHENCPIAGEACLTGSKDTMQYAVKVSEKADADDTRDLAIRTALNGAL
jgi:hypothetical protein